MLGVYLSVTVLVVIGLLGIASSMSMTFGNKELSEMLSIATYLLIAIAPLFVIAVEVLECTKNK